MGLRYQNFRISGGSTSIDQAVVSINGTTIPTESDGAYNYALDQILSPGEELVLRVELGGDVVEARATIPELSVITAPAEGQVITVGQPINVAWTAAADPDWWSISLYHENAGPDNSNVGDSVAATARSGSLPTADFPPTSGDTVDVKLFGYLNGSFTGPADPASTMRVRVPASLVSVVTGP